MGSVDSASCESLLRALLPPAAHSCRANFLQLVECPGCVRSARIALNCLSNAVAGVRTRDLTGEISLITKPTQLRTVSVLVNKDFVEDAWV